MNELTEKFVGCKNLVNILALVLQHYSSVYLNVVVLYNEYDDYMDLSWLLFSVSSVAPMMEWTDHHYRTLARLISKHAWLYTEMLAAETIVYQQSNLVS